MIEYNLLLEFDAIFPDEDHNLYLNRIKEIPKKDIINVSTLFLGYRLNNKEVSNLENLFNIWFRTENSGYANNLYKKILKCQEAARKKVIIINEVTNLFIFEAGLNNEVQELAVSEEEFEILFFKIYLAFNQKSIENERLAGITTNHFKFPTKINSLLVAQSLKYSDITEYNLKDSFVIQLAKIIYFFDEFSVKEEFKPLLDSFYQFYKVDGYKDFIKRYLALSSLLFKSERVGTLDIVVSEGSNQQKDSDFLERFAMLTSIEEDIDFRIVRSQPLLKLDEHTFRIIFPLFVIEKLYNGLYFKLRELNDQLPKGQKIKNLRTEITYNYSEKQLVYKLLQRCYAKKYIQQTGSSIEKAGIDGFVDYYIRNGNKVFIFESKDVLLNATSKESYDFSIIEKELRKKLYYEESEGKIIRRAILQLLNSIKILMEGKFSLDPNFKTSSSRIYPIIMLHNRQLEILGINQIIKSWFRDELEKLATESYNIENIKDVVILNVDTLISYSDQIFNKTIRLEDAIESYLEFTNQDVLKGMKFKNEEELSMYLRNSCISFSEFFRRKYPWKLPKIFQEKGYTVYSGLIDPSFRAIDPPAGGNNPEGRSLIVCNERLIC